LHFEITNCKNLKDIRVSTRALYGNFKNRMGFPRLIYNPVRYFGESIKCSVCTKNITYDNVNQFWISLRVGTDILPLLVNLCSEECKGKLQQPPNGYIQHPHKGGADIKQPTHEEWEEANVIKFTNEEIEKINETNKSKEPKLLKLIKKIWEK